ncbi:MAG TPA: type II toxin-antitoxin system VapC family toxin [Sphingomicrobium sp.]|jgi:PIN domain nuclease of toxin-antitoxin system|nr:type II toxin-antitoxin system VapC family toxin [Sphingomicrobium sp.]
MPGANALLLDTHAAIWLLEGQLSDASFAQVVAAGLLNGVFVSPVSGWEVGLLARPRPNGQPLVTFKPDPQTWFANLLAQPIINEAPLTSKIAIDSSFLPQPFHNDPADRLLVSTAREMNIPLLTRDKRILDYSAAGHVQAIAC